MILVSLFLVGSAFATVKDFSGTWILDSKKTAPDVIQRTGDRPLVLKQDAKSFSWNTYMPISCSTDGSRTKTISEDVEVVCQYTNITDSKIEFNLETRGVNSPSSGVQYTTVTLELGSDGKSLIVDVVDRVGDAKSESRRFFTKQP
jgi:hypothetical protein